MNDLWNKRVMEFWKEVAPYLKFVLNGGLIAFIVISFSIGSIYYRRFLENPPPDFPIHFLLTCIMLLFIALNPIRTYLREADLIYLVPAEHQMNKYFNKSITASFITQGSVLTFIWILLYPLYLVTNETNSMTFFIFLLMLFIFKWILMLGNWQEQQFQSNVHRKIYSVLRWLISFVVLYVLLTFNSFKGFVFIGIVLMTYFISFRLIPSYMIHWNRLIFVEQQHKARIYAFLSWFVDVPQLSKRVKHRKMLSRSIKLVPFQQENTYLYLYFVTWIRSDLFGMIVRMTLVGIVLVTFLSIVWMKYFIFIAVVYLSGLQILSLRHYHQNMFWVNIYPLPKELRIEGVLKNSFRIHIIIILIISIPFILTITNLILGFVLLALSILLSKIYHRSLGKKL
ncbi:ABC transporter permease [Chengkuizengella axinellae]|uniref:ABC transporter permease n=1 Tax=Chengkuizengella axinellae TaxID=3064388 RepID=A0ABT9ITF0_9BACL|nr:ABC transporter permease [Chengkuizengella sp. 2205SS18-9]MDP5272631.1 ABC transporter permease [Chengkuizengella sp. 2205SS18-9]